MSVTVTEPKYKVPEVAKHLRKAEKTVWKMIGEGKIAVYRIGRNVVVGEKELTRILEESFCPAKSA
jgi:hypothetical protein